MGKDTYRGARSPRGGTGDVNAAHGFAGSGDPRPAREKPAHQSSPRTSSSPSSSRNSSSRPAPCPHHGGRADKEASFGKGHGRRLRGFGQEDEKLARAAEALSWEKLEHLPEEGSFQVHVAPRGLLGVLLEELADRALAVKGRAVLARSGPLPHWTQISWTRPFWLEIASIADAKTKLRAVQRNWRAHLDKESGLNRRAVLIEEALPHVGRKPLVFERNMQVPTAPLGAFLLWDKNLVLASADTTSPFADGEPHFEENRLDPPGRAYLKLWEAFTTFGRMPKEGELCVELGASPGGWTWVLGSLGARVFSLDKAPLARNVAAMPNVEHCLGSGFALDPSLLGKADWLFSDMICCPERLLELLQKHLAARSFRRAVCTIKFRSDQDHNLVSAFAGIPGSSVRHLSCNRHELTWFYERPDEGSQEN